MTRLVEQLTELKIRNAKPKDKDYKLRDGEGLYLHIKKMIKKYGEKIIHTLAKEIPTLLENIPKYPSRRQGKSNMR